MKKVFQKVKEENPGFKILIHIDLISYARSLGYTIFLIFFFNRAPVEATFSLSHAIRVCISQQVLCHDDAHGKKLEWTTIYT